MKVVPQLSLLFSDVLIMINLIMNKLYFAFNGWSCFGYYMQLYYHLFRASPAALAIIVG